VRADHGSYGVAPLEVTAAQRQLADAVERWPDDFFRRKSFPAFEAAAAEAARFLRAPAGSVVFVENATTGVNAVLASLDLKRGDAVLMNDNSYNACKNAARHVCARAGAAVLYQDLPFPEALARGDDGVVADFAAFLDANAAAHAADPARAPRIRFALVDHITSPTAVVLPVARLAAACRARGVLVMVDGAHAPGQIEVDLTALGEAGVDWYVGNLHKWCFAPKGVAVLFAAARHQGAEAFAGGGTQAAVVSHFYQKSFAKRFWMQGTNDQSRLLATGAALRFCEARLGGFGAVRAYNAALASAGAQLLCAAWGTRRMYDPALSAPFLAVVETPLDWRRWVRIAGPGDAPGAAPTADATRLSPAAALAALDADEGFNERVSEAVLFNYGINGVFFTWTVGGEKRRGFTSRARERAGAQRARKAHASARTPLTARTLPLSLSFARSIHARERTSLQCA
jgi:isopenicillin-N epimerase